MPLDQGAQVNDPSKFFVQKTRGTTQSQRGLARANVVPDENAIEKRAKARGDALDFVPQFERPQNSSRSASRPTLTERGLISPNLVGARPERQKRTLPAPATPKSNVKTSPTRKPSVPKADSRKVTRPKVVRQLLDDDCWAAALESWLGAVGDPKRQQTQAQLTKGMPSNDHSFDVETFRLYVASFGMDTKIIDISEFSPDRINQILATTHKPVFVAYPMENYSPWWHDVVLYDVKTDSLNEGNYSVMNPSGAFLEPGHRGWTAAGFQKWEKRHFFPAKERLLIGWKAKGRSGKLW